MGVWILNGVWMLNGVLIYTWGLNIKGGFEY